jgi:signal peptidase I
MVTEAHLQAACCDLVSDVVRVSGQVQLKVTGASMVPVLWPGDLLMVRQVEPSSPTPGSILVFRQNDKLVVHRLASREGDKLVTRGDARPCFDPPVDAANVLGRVESAQRNGRTLALQPSLGQIIVAFFLRRSEGCTSIYLRLLSRVRRFTVSAAELQPIDPVRP